MPRLLTAVCVLAAGLAWLTQAQAAELRVALVIGNGAYQNAPRLLNPVNDATDVATALKQLGFETILATDLDKNGMDDAAIRFARAARVADVAMFYYSGHAIQFAGVNYLAPVDAKLKDEADLRRMFRADEVVADLQQARNLRILVLDSCRDNPLAEELRRSIGATRALPLQRGLAKMDAQGMIVAYATQAGRTAEDGAGRNSPYTAAFLKNIEAPEEIGTIFRRVSADVYETTKHNQLPELSLSLIGEFYLKAKIEIAITQDALPTPQAPPPQRAEDPAVKAWTATQNTTSVAVLEEFIRQFGDSVYAGMARARLEELKKSQVAVTSPPTATPSTTTTNEDDEPLVLNIDTLTRKKCWITWYSNGDRKICFFRSGRVTVTNIAGKQTCEMFGTYTMRDADITLTIPPKSGKCNNAPAPGWSVDCHFGGRTLDCKGFWTTGGKRVATDDPFYAITWSDD